MYIFSKKFHSTILCIEPPTWLSHSNHIVLHSVVQIAAINASFILCNWFSLLEALYAFDIMCTRVALQILYLEKSTTIGEIPTAELQFV